MYQDSDSIIKRIKELNKIKENELIKKAPHFVGFFVCGMMVRFG